MGKRFCSVPINEYGSNRVVPKLHFCRRSFVCDCFPFRLSLPESAHKAKCLFWRVALATGVPWYARTQRRAVQTPQPHLSAS